MENVITFLPPFSHFYIVFENIPTLNTFKDRCRSPCDGNHFFRLSVVNWRASEASETLSGMFNRESRYMYIL